MNTTRDQFTVIYNEGKKNGLLHGELSEHFKAENARKCAEGCQDKHYPRVMAYWLGYRDGMNALAALPS